MTIKRGFCLVLILLACPGILGIEMPWYQGRIVPIIWQCCYLTLASTSLNMIVGHMGQLSLGHSGFMAIGAYTAALFSLWVWRTGVFLNKDQLVYVFVVFLSLIMAGALAGSVGLLIGIPALRLKGDYLAIITLGFGMIIVNLINNIPFAGMEGLSLGSASSSLYRTGLGFTNYHLYKRLWIPLLVTGGCIWLMERCIGSALGRNIRAIGDDQIGAEASGVDVSKNKILLFGFSSAMAGVAGGLYACFMSSLSTSTFAFSSGSIMSSTFLVAMCVMGGLGSMKGIIMATCSMCVLNYLIGQLGLNSMPGVMGIVFSYPMLVYGVALMAMVLWIPRRKKWGK